jgi:hypothetical protein
MEISQFESLLYRGESETLDFKRDQYPWMNQKDADRVELLKDIVAFSNAWRTEEAYIITGVQEQPGMKGTIFGVTYHLPDHDVQQFVNAKTQRAIQFNYESITYEGKQCGIIRIPVQQRPFYLKSRFCSLDSGKVYLRRGSSTAVADPDEVAKMGASIAGNTHRPSFRIVAAPKVRTNFAQGKAQFELIAKIINTGTATAHDVLIAEVRQPTTRIVRYSTSMWSRMLVPGGRGLMCQTSLHPSAEQNIALWAMGKAHVKAEVMSQLTARKSLTFAEIAPVFVPDAFSINLTVFCRDNQPTLFELRFSKAEVEQRMVKTFEPV